MYIHHLPFEIETELCSLFDVDDYWKDLAVEMKMSKFIAEIEQDAKRLSISPTQKLLKKWGYFYNHEVKELCTLLFWMQYVPALRCLMPVVDNSYHRLLTELCKSGNMQIKKKVDDPQCRPKKNGASIMDEILKSAISVPKISYEELEIATDNWNERNVLGSGGFGKVYRGEWQYSSVAIKKLKNDDPKNKELTREMAVNYYRHDNILPLYGYSVGGPEPCLVYQLMAGGSLEQRLRGRTRHPLFTWPQRYRVAHGVARGLQFLHNMQPSLIHGDIKPANILLDDALTPKIGDFGLAKKGPKNDKNHLKVPSIFGTRAYLPDEYLRSNELSPAVDVFSFGVVLLEMATARPALDDSRPIPALSGYMWALARKNINFAPLEDPALRGRAESNLRLFGHFIEIGLSCTQYRRLERPTMLDVFKTFVSLKAVGVV